MAFTDWDIFDVGVDYSLNGNNPILDDGSLDCSGTNGTRLTAQLNNSFQGAFTKGRIRTLMRTESVVSIPDDLHVGVYFMSEVEDMTSVGVDSYMVAASPTNNADNVELKKVTNGVADFSAATILASGTFDFTIGNVMALEVDWIADEDEIGGVRVKVRVGGETDFSDLVEIIDFIHLTFNNVPLFTTMGEGLALQALNPGNYVTQFDQTTVYKGF